MVLTTDQKNELKKRFPYMDFDDPNIKETRSCGVTIECKCGHYGYDRDYHLKKCPKCGVVL